MSQQRTTTSSASFNQPSMGVFNSLQPSIGANLQSFMSNPLASSFFQNQMGMASQANNTAFGANNAALMNNMNTAGFTNNGSGFMQSQLLQNSRALSAANSNSFNNLLLGANQLRFGATQMGSSYRPLQTGSSQVQSVGGVGSWAPQIAGAAVGSLFGGSSGLFGPNAFGGGGSMMYSPTNMMTQNLPMSPDAGSMLNSPNPFIPQQ